MSDPKPLVRLRAVIATLPDSHEVEAWGEPTFRIRHRVFAMYADAGNHHGGGRAAVWCLATPEDQRLLIQARPEAYFSPPYVGSGGWVGAYLDRKPDWKAVTQLLKDGYDMAFAKGPGRPSAAKNRRKTGQA